MQTVQLPLLNLLKLENLLELPGWLSESSEDGLRDVLTDCLFRSTPQVVHPLQFLNPELPHLLVQLVVSLLHAKLLPVRGDLLE